MLYSLTYVSSATQAFSPTDLSGLLEVSRRNNEAVLITGLLLFKEGNFMQVLEGNQVAVDAVHERILKDPRHRGCITLLQGPIGERAFGGWAMGFRDLEREPAQGFSELLNTPFTGVEFSAEPTKAQRLLLSFKRHM